MTCNEPATSSIAHAIGDVILGTFPFQVIGNGLGLLWGWITGLATFVTTNWLAGIGLVFGSQARELVEIPIRFVVEFIYDPTILIRLIGDILSLTGF